MSLFYTINELNICANDYMNYMDNKIKSHMDELINSDPIYLALERDEYDNLYGYDIKDIHYIDNDINSVYHGKYFKILQEKYILLEPPIYLIDESGTHNIFEFEIFPHTFVIPSSLFRAIHSDDQRAIETPVVLGNFI